MISFRTALAPFTLALAAAAAAGCDRTPAVELTPWSAADHEGEKKSGGSAKQGAKGDAGSATALVEITWQNQCASCHGPQGRGDGPQGAMFKAKDLSRADWQADVKDDEIAAAIVNGKGRMPKFELPEEIVRGLVARVRSFRAP